jgi:hypothetical protein
MKGKNKSASHANGTKGILGKNNCDGTFFTG